MTQDINLKELIGGIVNQLRYVDRFATCRRGHRENIAEHQYFTAFFTLVIGRHIPDVDLGKAVTRALVHDVEEHYTGDIIRPVKHGTPEVKEAFEKTGAEFTQKFFNSLTKADIVSGLLFDDWLHAKDKSLEGRLVRFADFLSVLAYVHQEVMSGNRLVTENVHQLNEYAQQFTEDRESYAFLGQLPLNATTMVINLYSQTGAHR